MLDEPPGADPHAGWCGDWGLETPGYPIMPYGHVFKPIFRNSNRPNDVIS